MQFVMQSIESLTIVLIISLYRLGYPKQIFQHLSIHYSSSHYKTYEKPITATLSEPSRVARQLIDMIADLRRLCGLENMRILRSM